MNNLYFLFLTTLCLFVLTSTNAQNNVGIGTASPTEKLEITGNVKSNMFLDRDDPTYFLDPSGTTSGILNGNVGIGTTSPDFMLDVNGNMELTGSSRVIYFGRSTEGGPHGLNFYNDEARLYYRTNPNQIAFENSGGDMFWVDADDNNAYFKGDVGIGTTSPSANLHIAGSVRSDNLGGSGNVLVEADNNGDLVKNPYSGSSSDVLTGDGSWTDIGSLSDGDWNIVGSDLESAVSGNVGIGMAPTEKLSVNGGVEIAGDGSGDVGAIMYNPTESGTSSNRWAMRFDLTDDASYPYLTNRTPGGDVAIKTGTASGGGENEHFRIEGGDGIVNAYFTDANLGIGTNTPSERLDVGGGNIEFNDNILQFSRTDQGQIFLDSGDDFHIRNDQQNNEIVVYDGGGGVGLFFNGTETFEVANGITVRDNMNISSNNIDNVGNINITGELQASGNGGNSGQVLLSTGGGIDWEDAGNISDGDWTINGNDQYSTVSGNVGVGTSSPSGKLHVDGNLVVNDDNGNQIELRRSENNGGLAYAMLEPRKPIPSVKTASELNYGGSSSLFPNVKGESDAQGGCFGPATYEQAVAEAEARGARLPTIEELEAEVTAGTGCGFDNEICWTQTKAGPGKRWVNYGKPSNFSNGGREARDETATAHVRFVADVDHGDRKEMPAIVDNSGRLRADNLRARSNGGLRLDDESGNLGLFLDNGGNIGVKTTPDANASLHVDGAIIAGGRSSTLNESINTAFEGIRMPGSTSDYIISTQDGNGRIQHKWNATSATGETYMVSSEPAWFWDLSISSDPYMEFKYATGGTAGNAISWVTHMAIQQDGNVGIGTTSPNFKLDVNGTFNSNGITETSDRRMKKDVQQLEGAIGKVQQLRGVSYHWRTKEFPDKGFEDDAQIGVIAQEVEKVLPEVVHTDSKGYKSVEYSHLTPLLIEAVKELSNENQELRAENQQFKKRLEALEAKVEEVVQNENTHQDNARAEK